MYDVGVVSGLHAGCYLCDNVCDVISWKGRILLGIAVQDFTLGPLDGEKMETFLGLPVTWTPTTWIFRNGRLRYAFNYGELRFLLVQQLLRDTTDKWDR